MTSSSISSPLQILEPSLSCPQMYVFGALIFFRAGWAASSEGLTLETFSTSQVSSMPNSYAEELDEASGLYLYSMPSGHSTALGKSEHQTDEAPFAMFDISEGIGIENLRTPYEFTSPDPFTRGTQSPNSENGGIFSTPSQSSSIISPNRNHRSKEDRQAPCSETEERKKCSWKTQQPLQITLDRSMNPVEPRGLRRRTRQQQSVTNAVRKLKACGYHRRAKKMVIPSCPGAVYLAAS